MATLSKADYLKRYLAGPPSASSEPKKKKKKDNDGGGFKPARMKIVEDDAFIAVQGAQRKPGDDEDDDEEDVVLRAEREARLQIKKLGTFKSAFAAADSDDEQKPIRPRRGAARHDSESSEDEGRKSAAAKKATKRHESDSDQSPPRRDSSPPRRQGNSKISAEGQKRSSAPRRRHDSDESPPRRSNTARRRHDSDSDASPPRRRDAEKSRNRSDSDQSPPRPSRKRNDSDSSPPRRQDKKPAERGNRGRVPSPDLSPPRRGAAKPSGKEVKREPQSDSEDVPSTSNRHLPSSKPVKTEQTETDGSGATKQKTLDGKKAGLQSARDLKEEMEALRKREKEMFETMGSSQSGRDAATVYRQKQTLDKKGRLETPEERAKKEREAAKQAELEARYKSWSKGLAQGEERAAKLEEMERVVAEPLTRNKDDARMNAHLKDQIDEKEDPMAKMLLAKRKRRHVESGRLVYPQYEGAYPPNRFSIPPGYRWDGVDRSNGFEGKLARKGNERVAQETSFYQQSLIYE